METIRSRLVGINDGTVKSLTVSFKLPRGMPRIQPENDPPNISEPSSSTNYSIDLVAMRTVSEPSCSSPMTIVNFQFSVSIEHRLTHQQMTDQLSQHTESGRAMMLSHMTLHSPSAILGTPLDPNCRFEYPFPSPDITEYSPSFLDAPMRSAGAALIPRIPEQWGKSSSLQHPKHLRQDPPVPPTLAKKRSRFDLHLPLSHIALHDVMITGCLSPGRRKMEEAAAKS